MISMRTGMVIIVLIVVFANLLVMGSPGGRGSDYLEYQQDEYEEYPDSGLVEPPKTRAELDAFYESYSKILPTFTPIPSIQPK